MSMEEAIRKYVNDEKMVFLGGFGNGITYSAAHEIIRQKKRKLKICNCSGGILTC
jgi:glutaconate CoA-transferase subunit A